MASTTAVSLEDLIDEALDLLYASTERPRQYTVGATALAADSDTTLTITGVDDNFQAPAILEHDQELMLVTDRSDDADPVFTVFRGYGGTPKSNAPTGTVLLVNPRWERFKVRRQIVRALQGPIATQLPAVKTAQVTPTLNQFYVEAPEDALRIRRLAVTSLNLIGAVNFKHWQPFDDWEFVDDAPAAASSTGKLITIPSWTALANVSQPITFYITYEAPYAWSGGTGDPAEDETVDLPAGSFDLPALYASAYLVLNREISRTQVDRVTEWTQQETDPRNQANLRLAQMLWAGFYHRLDDARRLQVVPKHRPYRPRRKL